MGIRHWECQSIKKDTGDKMNEEEDSLTRKSRMRTIINMIAGTVIIAVLVVAARIFDSTTVYLRCVVKDIRSVGDGCGYGVCHASGEKSPVIEHFSVNKTYTDKSPMTHHDKLILFTRYPEPGTTKTRLIAALGADGAAELHRQMAERAVGVARELRAMTGVAVEIRYDGGDDCRMRQWLGNDMVYAVQTGLDLGERMDHAFKDGFDRGYDRIVVMGSDCPELTAGILKEAFQSLDRHPVVLGPAADGGYYLIGLKQRFPRVFQEIPWGTASVLESTRKTLLSLEVPFALLERLGDVDTPEDLHIWENFQKTRISRDNSLSVIIPSLNESDHIRQAIQSARSGNPLEVIVVDGGSCDGTVQLAVKSGATVIQAPRGRAVQMNAGAEISRGHHLLFLHADTRLPDRYALFVSEILNDSACRRRVSFWRCAAVSRTEAGRMDDQFPRAPSSNALWRSGDFCPQAGFYGHGRLQPPADHGGLRIYQKAEAQRAHRDRGCNCHDRRQKVACAWRATNHADQPTGHFSLPLRRCA